MSYLPLGGLILALFEKRWALHEICLDVDGHYLFFWKPCFETSDEEPIFSPTALVISRAYLTPPTRKPNGEILY